MLRGVGLVAGLFSLIAEAIWCWNADITFGGAQRRWSVYMLYFFDC